MSARSNTSIKPCRYTGNRNITETNEEAHMSANNYFRTITVTGTPDEAFRALTVGFDRWWTTPDQPIINVGDRAKFNFPPGTSYWTFEATRLSPSKRVELECVDALHVHEGQPREIEKEWLGTKAIWRIEARGDETAIHFEHVGLTPALICFGICKQGWDFFFVDSLKAYLDTGEGKPHRTPT